MKSLKRILLVAGCVAAVSLSAGNAMAQGRGNFDPAEFRQRMMDRYKEEFEVKDDAEWKVIEAAIGKVMDARMEVGFGGGGMFFRGNRGGDRGDRGNRGGNNNNSSSSSSSSQGDRRQRGPFGAPSAEAEDLQKAIESKASADEIKAKLAKLREANKAKEAKLEQAQADLRKLLTAKQEAVAVLGGLLK